ncbi:unnamed protein product [Acanthosepion pharaonis]|uniref:Uncharacterized protein n=1 Tax=Acanthosepion pharaonis TaxID=158019 RepID=A0A812DK14_ACAPH|nr:unnamed protein product [Sepia pharaonis]
MLCLEDGRLKLAAIANLTSCQKIKALYKTNRKRKIGFVCLSSFSFFFFYPFLFFASPLPSPPPLLLLLLLSPSFSSPSPPLLFFLTYFSPSPSLSFLFPPPFSSRASFPRPPIKTQERRLNIFSNFFIHLFFIHFFFIPLFFIHFFFFLFYRSFILHSLFLHSLFLHSLLLNSYILHSIFFVLFFLSSFFFKFLRPIHRNVLPFHSPPFSSYFFAVVFSFLSFPFHTMTVTFDTTLITNNTIAAARASDQLLFAFLKYPYSCIFLYSAQLLMTIIMEEAYVTHAN